MTLHIVGTVIKILFLLISGSDTFRNLWNGIIGQLLSVTDKNKVHVASANKVHVASALATHSILGILYSYPLYRPLCFRKHCNDGPEVVNGKTAAHISNFNLINIMDYLFNKTR